MSVFNTPADWLRESIDSILNQTFSDFEFIIINDGSTENVGDVIKSYDDSRIVYVEQENAGLPVALNRALDMAKGEYIARMDSDDISVEDRFKKQLKYFDEHPEVSLLGGWYQNSSTGVIYKLPENVTYMKLLNHCCIGHPSVMFRKSDFDKYGFRYNEEYRVAQDYELWSRVIKVLKIANVQDVLLRYRWHEKNASVSKKSIQDGNAVKIRQSMLDWLSDDDFIKKQIFDILYKPKFNFFEKIFSMKNQNCLYGEKYKLITILGFEFKIKRG